MSRRTSIALLITELNVGGAERALTQLAVGLDPAQFEVTVYCLAPRPKPGEDELVTRLEQAGIPLEFLAARGTWQTAGIVWRLRRVLRRDRPQVLLSFLYHANVIGGFAAASLKNRPIHVAAVRVAEPGRWRLWLEGFFLRRAARVTCVSRMLAEHVAEFQRVPFGRIETIANGVDWERFAAAEPADLSGEGIGPERRLLTAIGRLDHQKGFDWLLRHAGFLKQIPEFDLVIVGDGPDRIALEKMARASTVAAQIHFLGRRNDIPAILRRSEGFLLPSRYEGMPNVVLEAMAAGLPIVATPVEGIQELLGPNAEAQTAPHYDSTAYAEAIYAIVCDPLRSAELGLANQQRAAGYFTWQAMIDGYSELLRGVSTRSKQKSS